MSQIERFLTLASKLIGPTSRGHLACVHIKQGWCMITNSRVSYTQYIEDMYGLHVTVDAKKLLAALRGCAFAPDTLKQTDKNLLIGKGSFKARIGLMDNDTYPSFYVWGDDQDLGINTFAILKKLKPFIGTDASRPQYCAIMFDGTYAWATNNVVLVRQPLSTPRSFVLPVFAFDELVRADSDVIRVAIGAHGMRFDMADGISLHTRTLDMSWPDVNAIVQPTDAPPVPDGMKEGVLALVPLSDNMHIPRLTFNADGMITEEGHTRAAVTGLSFNTAHFNAKLLLTVLDVATHLDMSTYPRCYFRGDNGLEGMVMGMR